MTSINALKAVVAAAQADLGDEAFLDFGDAPLERITRGHLHQARNALIRLQAIGTTQMSYLLDLGTALDAVRARGQLGEDVILQAQRELHDAIKQIKPVPADRPAIFRRESAGFPVIFLDGQPSTPEAAAPVELQALTAPVHHDLDIPASHVFFPDSDPRPTLPTAQHWARELGWPEDMPAPPAPFINVSGAKLDVQDAAAYFSSDGQVGQGGFPGDFRDVFLRGFPQPAVVARGTTHRDRVLTFGNNSHEYGFVARTDDKGSDFRFVLYHRPTYKVLTHVTAAGRVPESYVLPIRLAGEAPHIDYRRDGTLTFTGHYYEKGNEDVLPFGLQLRHAGGPWTVSAQGNAEHITRIFSNLIGIRALPQEFYHDNNDHHVVFFDNNLLTHIRLFSPEASDSGKTNPEKKWFLRDMKRWSLQRNFSWQEFYSLLLTGDRSESFLKRLVEGKDCYVDSNGDRNSVRDLSFPALSSTTLDLQLSQSNVPMVFRISPGKIENESVQYGKPIDTPNDMRIFMESFNRVLTNGHSGRSLKPHEGRGKPSARRVHGHGRYGDAFGRHSGRGVFGFEGPRVR